MPVPRPVFEPWLCRMRRRSTWMVATVLLALVLTRNAPAAVPFTFFPGSLIIPTDTGANGQDAGMLRAYGLVYELLRHNVPVYWVINPAKFANGNDFTIGGGSLQDVRTGALLAARSYRGGPFVIADANAAEALPIVQAWQAAAGDATAVHRLTSGSFMPDVSRLLVGAPRIAILKDGYEAIAFNELNAAGIPDAVGGTWTVASPDLLTESDIAGPTESNHADGALLHQPSGLARFCTLLAMHYTSTATTTEVVREVRSWLTATPASHAFMQCEAIRTFENDPSGLFLTTAGLVDDGPALTAPAVRVPSHPLAQIDGTFQANSGMVDSIGLQSGSTFKSGVQAIINENSAPLTSRIALLTGPLDGASGNAEVTYLAGHDYSVDLPISTNPQTNGVRLFLNSLFESRCATDTPEANVALTMSAPASVNSSTITYMIDYSNPGFRPVENVRLTDTLPAGTAFASATGGGSHAGGVVTWNLPPLAPGAAGSVSVTVTVAADGAYTNSARMWSSQLVVKAITSNSVTTVRDTVAPTVSIPVPPNVTATNDTTPSFVFTVGADAVATTCRIDAGAPAPCTSPFTAAVPLTDGSHSLEVRATDAAGNLGNATRVFVVDTVAPTVNIPVLPNGPATSDTTPSFVFTVVDAGVVTTTCRIDGGPFGPCTSPFTAAVPLTDGSHVVAVQASDAAGNLGSATRVFVVDTVAPTVNIPVLPNGPATSDTTPSFVFTVVDAGVVTTTCRIDGGPFAPCTSPFTAAVPLTNGSHVVAVQASDAAGNLGSATRAFVVDTTPPAIAVTAPVSGGIYGLGSNVASVVVCTDTGGSGVTTCSYPATLSTGTIGSKLFTATAVDAAGNMTTANVTYLVRGKDACKAGGWAQFVSPKFSNQGQCLSMLP